MDLTINTNRATLKWGNFVDPSHARSDRARRLCRLQPGTEAGGVGRQSGRRPVRRRRHQQHGDFPAGDQLPDEQQFATVLPGVLHLVQAAVRPVDGPYVSALLRRRLQRRHPQRRAGAQRQFDPDLPLERLAARPDFQCGRACAGVVAVSAERSVFHRRRQRRRQRRSGRLQRQSTGSCRTSDCWPTTAAAGCV